MLHPLVPASLSVLLGLPAIAPPIASHFTAGAEGWVIRDLNCSNYAQVVGGGTISWIGAGGDPDGFIRSTDPSSNCYSYEAPAAFVGNRSAYLAGSFCWSIRTNVNDWLPGSVLILIGGGTTLVADVPQPASGAWLRYCVPLTASSFTVGSAGGAAATPAQLNSVLAALGAVRISAEFGSEAGEETVDLDSVILRGPCAADLDGDGQVNGADLGLLLGAWGSAGSIADLEGDGTVNGADLGLLLGSWGPCA